MSCAEDAPRISITLGAVTVKAGEDVRAAISIDVPTGAPQPAAISWTLQYPNALVPQISAVAGPATTAAHKQLACGAGTKGVMKCLIYGVNKDTLNSGVLALVTFHAGGTRQAASAPVEVVDVMAVSLAAKVIPGTATNGSISITP